jgi:hypothetical protein
MTKKDPFDLIGKCVERATSNGETERGIIKDYLPDGRVIVKMEHNKQTVILNPAANTEWTLIERIPN